MEASHKVFHDAKGGDKVLKRRVITGSVLLGILVLSILVVCLDPVGYVMGADDTVVSTFNAASPTADAPALVSGDIAWMLVATALVLLMTPGLAFFYGGMVRAKNVISTLLQSYFAMGVITLLWTYVGFSLAFGDSVGGIFGNPATYYFYNNVGAAPAPALTPSIPVALYSLFQLKFAIITPALISGALAERVRFTSFILFITMWSVLCYCPLAHMVWHPDGIIRKFGTLDFAGGTVVHMSSGYAALVGSWILGPRVEPPTKTTPANIPFVMLGTSLLWFGWFGFNAGSALTASPLAVQAFLTTNTAASSAMITWVLMDHIRGSKSTAMGACVGAVVGLVGITPAAGYVTVGAALIIGIVTACISNFVAHIFNEKARIDDTLDVWPCHGLGGTSGMILTSLFATTKVNSAGFDGAFYGNPTLLGKHLAVLVCVVPYIMIMSYICYFITNLIYPLRVSAKSEKLGLDMSQHNESIALPGEEDEYKADDHATAGIEMAA